MEQKLQNIFTGPIGTSDSCLGLKYASNGTNIWTLDYQDRVI
jgi:hypothetical protein